MVLQSFHVARTFRIDQIYANIIKEGALITAIHQTNAINLSIDRNNRLQVFCKKDALRNFAKFTGNICARVSFLIKLLRKRLWHWCYSVNFAKFLRTAFLTEDIWWVLPHRTCYVFF